MLVLIGSPDGDIFLLILNQTYSATFFVFVPRAASAVRLMGLANWLFGRCETLGA